MADTGLSSDADIQAALQELPGWKREGKTLVKTYDMHAFKGAVAFVSKVADLAERADHHPDIFIQVKKVTVTLSSHDVGGVSARDLRLARQIEAAAKDQTT